MPFSPILNVNPDTFKTAVNSRFGAEIICQDPKVPADYGFKVKEIDEIQNISAQPQEVCYSARIVKKFSDENIFTTQLSLWHYKSP